MAAGPIALHEAQRLPINRIHRAPWNANVANGKTLEKIRRSLERYGSVENSVVRPTWCIGARSDADVHARKESQIDPNDTSYETLSGNHRLDLYREAGLDVVPCVVVELPDAEARMLAQTLNRTRGTDDPDRLKALLKDVVADIPVTDISSILPQSERDLAALMNSFPEPGSGPGNERAPEKPKDPVSRPGYVYLLGPHRLMCGDAENPSHVAELLDGDKPRLCVTDPPYGVNYDPSWREEVGRAPGRRLGAVQNDDRANWRKAWELFPGDVIYSWVADLFQPEAMQGIESAGFVRRSVCIWVKPNFTLSRGHYHWKHEPCIYAVRKGSTAEWLGDRSQTTVWDDIRQVGGFGKSNSPEDEPTAHGTQKPLECMERPIRHHAGDVYEPFAGSGTTLIAASRLDRKCYAMELDPGYCDVIRARWGRYAQQAGLEPGDAL